MWHPRVSVLTLRGDERGIVRPGLPLGRNIYWVHSMSHPPNAGQLVKGFYIEDGVTIFRNGNDYLTVASDGRVLSYVKNATPQEGVALRYIQLGGH